MPSLLHNSKWPCCSFIEETYGFESGRLFNSLALSDKKAGASCGKALAIILRKGDFLKFVSFRCIYEYKI